MPIPRKTRTRQGGFMQRASVANMTPGRLIAKRTRSRRLLTPGGRRLSGCSGSRRSNTTRCFSGRVRRALSASAKALTVGGCILTIATLPGKFAGFFATIATVGLECFATMSPYSNGRSLTCPDCCGCCS